MNPFPILLSSFRRAPLTALIVVVLVALAVGLGTCVSLMEPSLRRGTTAAAGQFDLLAGASGSEIQLVLSSVYLDSTPLPMLSTDNARELAVQLHADPGVAWFSPLLFGDTWQRHPIVGVNSSFVNAFAAPDVVTDLSETEAWVGALVSLQPGERFQSTHGQLALSAQDVHEHAYVVRGKLQPTGTPWDRAILVNAGSVWSTHGMHAEGTEEHEEKATHDQIVGPVSSLVIKPVSVSDAYRLRGQLRTEQRLALFPAEVLVRLYASLGDVQTLFTGMARLAQVTVLVSVLMAMFAGMARRRKALGVLRALGAPRIYGALASWLEVMLLLTTGSAVGLALGYAACVFGADLFAARTGILLPVRMGMSEYALFWLTVGLGSIAALLPAVCCYRMSVSEALRAG